jgi:hypothetical protein
MDVCLCLFVLCCPVLLAALRWTDPPPPPAKESLRWTDPPPPPAKESYQMSNGSKKLKQEPQMARHC